MYRELNDYEVLYLICDSDDQEYEIMLKKYYPLIVKLVNKYKYIVKKMGYEVDDLYQIGYLTLHQSIKGFNGSKNSNLFYTYFVKSLENAILNIMRTNNTNKKKSLNESISYDNQIPGSNLTYAEIFPDPNTLISDFNQECELRYNIFKNNLSFDLACILDLKVEGYNNREIAILLDMTPSTISSGIKEIRNKMIFF